MKKIIFILAVWVMAGAGVASAQGNFTFQVNQTVPDADANGLALVGNVSGLSGTIASVTAALNITNGYNGDLYAYLTGPNGGFAVLLNRVGVSNSASAAGYGTAGLDVTFTASGNDVHYYQSLSPVYNSGGQLTGSWAADGRAIDPASAPSTFAGTAPSATLASFTGTNPNGNWVLFVADFSGGAVSLVNHWDLNITATSTPEPGALALLTAASVFVAALTRRTRRKN